MYIKMQLVKYKFIIVIYENILLFIKYKNIYLISFDSEYINIYYKK